MISSKIIKMIDKKKSRMLFFIMFLTILLVPHGTAYYFNGVPWKNTSETIVIILLLPYFYYFRKTFDNDFIQYLIIISIILKITLFFSPNAGIAINQFFSTNNIDDKKYIKTFDSFWDPNFSSIQKQNWENKRSFPIDWTSANELNYDSDIKNDVLEYYEKTGQFVKYYTLRDFKFNDYEEFINMPMFYKFKSFLYINKSAFIKFTFDGSDNAIINIDKKEYNGKNLIKLKPGIYKLDIQGKFTGNEWSSSILTSLDGEKFESAFKKRQLYIEKPNKNVIKYQILISYLFEIIIFSLILFFILFTIKNNKKLFFYSFSFFIFYLFTNYLANIFLNFINIKDYYGSFGLSLSILLVVLYLSVKKKIAISYKDIFFVIIIPVILFYFINRNFDKINHFSWFSKGDDWQYFQVYARDIVVNNNWINSDEAFTIRRYGIRLIIAVQKILFGKSVFAQSIFEIWAILLSCYFTFKIAIKLKLNEKLAFISGMLLLFLYLGENYRWLIGRGLSEYYSLFLVIYLSYFIINNKLNYKNVIISSAIAGTIVWFREDYIFFVWGFFFLYEKSFISDSNKNGISNIINISISRINYLAIYSAIILFFVILLLTKNIISFGQIDSLGGTASPIVGKINSYYNIFISDENHITYYNKKNYFWHSHYRIFFAADPGKIPRITSIFLFGAFLISLYLMFFKLKKFKKINPGLIFSILLVPMTYLLLNNGAYNPRYTIHYLPYSIILFMLFFTNLNLVNFYNIKIFDYRSSNKDAKKNSSSKNLKED